MSDIVDKLVDLHKQATTERSHYYVANVVKEAVAEIISLRLKVCALQNDLVNSQRKKKA